MAIKTLKIQPGRMKGLYQGIDQNLLNFAYSPDCQNFTVKDGILTTRSGIAKFISIPVAIDDNTLGIGYAHKIMRLESVSLSVTGLTTNGIPIIGVYFADGDDYRWYAYHKAASDSTAATWNLITTNGVTAAMTDVSPDLAHVIEYKISDEPYLIVAGGGDIRKLHLHTTDGSPDTYAILAETLSTDAPDDTVYLALHRERVWTAGKVLGVGGAYVADVNTVTYSNAYDATDWATAGETGEIKVETFDGDYIRTITNALDDVLIFKRNTIFKVTGDTPDTYAVAQVYSVNGTIYGDSVCTDGAYCFFAASDGIYQYDGTVGKPLLVKEIKTLYDTLVNPAMVCNNNKLYVWDRQTITANAAYTGKCIVYDLISKTIDVIYTNDMYDLTVSNGTVLFTDGNYIYQLAG